MRVLLIGPLIVDPKGGPINEVSLYIHTYKHTNFSENQAVPTAGWFKNTIQVYMCSISLVMLNAIR